ncbi:MarR family transcriptional regulator [Listeria fleischmannii]|uniref:MarR family transcriptional regulator n=1 Tax=Listeria fleischmannii TaxID=1069827 RepID=UPI0016250075|nr:MarR family transcriptional regulator [Listeria fleischmannii]MBC1418688.1 MarR family transcriptional regulator [Listeria fleischmannii]
MEKQEEVLLKFRDLFNKMAWLNKEKMEQALQGHKPSEVHCMEYIGDHVDSNVTKMAGALYMTRGAISKITKKLIQKGYIATYQKEANKKEVYFSLTPEGEKVYQTHKHLHQTFQERDKIIFDQVTESQFDAMLRFIDLYSTHLDQEIEKENRTIE